MEKINQKLAGKALPTVIFTIFLDVLGVGILIPIIPQLLANPGSAYYLLPAGWTFKGGLILLGWLIAIYPIMQFISTPILGQLSDRYGRRKVLILSLLGTSVGYVLFAVGILTRNLPLLFISRALDGITGGNLSVAQAVIADVTPPQKRTKNFAFIGAAFGIGFVLGPYIGAKLGSPNTSILFGLIRTPSWFSPATPFWFTAALALINVMLIFYRLPETHPHINSELRLKFGQALHNIKVAVTYPGLRAVFPVVFLFWAGFSFFQTFFQVLLVNRLNFSQSNIGDYFAYIGIWIAFTQAVITPFIAHRFKNYQILRVSLFGTGLGLFLTLLAKDTTQLLLVTPIFAIFNGQVIANSTALVSLSADRKVQGEVLGINASVQALASAIPAILSGYLATIGIATPVIVGATTIVTSGILFALIYKPKGKVLAGDDPAQAAGMMH